jgi:VWFA-related protein
MAGSPIRAFRSPSVILYAALLLIYCSATASAIPQSPHEPNAASTQPQPSVIRTATRLVQVSVVVQDKKGAPIAGLKRESFILFDNGQPQQIAFFSANAAPPASAPALPANFFTNRSDLKGQDPGATVVLLFDSLNTSFEDQSFAQQNVLRFLKTFHPQDHVAIFALTNDLVLLHGFTEDVAALANSVNRFSPQLLAAFDASHPTNFNVSALSSDPFWKSFENHVNNANGQIADSRVADRFGTTYAALVAIADYVSTIPGRKSLVWVSGGIPIQIGLERIGVPDRDNFDFDHANAPGVMGDMSGLARVLNRANMAIYPIDVRGVDIDDSASSFWMRQDQREGFRELADKTGGKAFYGTNDVAGAIHSAFEDGRYTYTLGFYPDHGQWDGQFREIKIELPIAGAHLRYRRGYFALPDKSNHEMAMKTDLRQAALNVLDATDLGVTLKVKSLSPVSAHMLQLQVGLDPRQFLLHEHDNRLAGGLDLLFLQSDSTGNFLAAEKQHFDMDFKPKEYETLAKTGLILQRRINLDSKAKAIRILVRDADTGALGSVTVPVEKLI